ncbi:SusC/RagA family TonB-linked outer membrane protein [Flavobacterium sp. RSP15]|uniref:SusC/RagA family TonB-linked outer membrane protein n=1 Tax=Flavobacterium sp. RSP15 TaxID=2497485 RepID=UPI000F84868F|nr:TonB-dependent receptor [Flavobacterium sp. RSP15]RTY86253.1 TonB-dependent receptor [Flavobacterium sp. RSP15]
MKKIKFLMLFLLMVFSVDSWAQTEVTGVVLDDANSPIPGVNVLVKGNKQGIVTDFDGRFNIKASVSDVLVFSYIGFETQSVILKNYNKLNIKLQSSALQLDDLVVVGYGSKRKSDVTGAVTSVKSDQFNRGIVTSPEQLIQGKVSGVNITSASGEPGSNQTISIRGQGGVRSGSTPLFVVDGFALDNSGTGGATNPLSFINSDDIESIDVLKDASATAIYGARGANGVILITTKRGKKGASKVTYSTSLGTSSIAKEIPVYSADAFRSRVVEIGGELTDLGGSTNWQKEITRAAFTQNHNVSLSGGADNMTYFASIGSQDQQGIIKNSELKRLSGRINITQKLLNDRLKIDLNLNATNTISERPAIESLIGTALSLNPTYPAYDENGAPSIFPDVFNPLIRLKLYEDLTQTNRIIANISPSFEIIKGLDYKLNFGVDNSSSDRDIQNRPSTLPQEDGRLDSFYSNNKNTLIENYITYNFDLGENNFSLLAGHSFQKTFVQYRHWSIDRFKDNGIDPKYNPGLGQELDLIDNMPSGSAVKNELQSFFGRLNYSFQNRYLLTATFRRDGSSKFGSNNKYGNFPSFSAGWKISEEEFMQASPFSNLKVRAGWGRTGNQEIPSKITQASSTTSVSGSTSYPLYPTGTYPGGTTFARFANPDIQWEVSTQTNVGLDFGFFKGALSGTIDYFNKVSDNILLEVVPSDPIQPASTYWTNVKDMTITNRGLEFALAYQYKSEKGISFGFGGNVSFIDNKIENSPFTVLTTGSASGSGLSSATINGYVNGQPIGTFFMKEFIGINDQGMSQFRDANNDGLDTDADRVVAGSALPDKLFSFYGNLAYKAFDLNFNFNGVAGNKIYDNTANSNFYKARLAKSLNTTAPAGEFSSESITNPASISTRYLKNGAFLRLNNVSFGYTLKPESIGVGDWISSMRFSVTGQNLFVITDYDGYDPEVNSDRSVAGVTSYGIDYLSYPKARTFLFGFNVSF